MEQNIKTELLKYGFATIDYPTDLTELVAEAMESWQEFCALPLETKSRFIYTGDAGTGYEFKDEPGETKDRKENFHFTIDEMPRVFQIAADVDINSIFYGKSYLIALGVVTNLFALLKFKKVQINIHGALSFQSHLRTAKIHHHCCDGTGKRK